MGQSAAELKRQLALDRSGRPYLIHRDASGVQRLTELPANRPLRIGRSADADVPLTGDAEVSRLHAEIELAAGEWVVADDGLSSNGSFVNGERVASRRRLRDADVLRLGETVIVFRNPSEPAEDNETAHAGAGATPADLTQAQRRVLEVLCEPVRRGGSTVPASNQEIADALHISIGSVKAHLRALFEKFSVEDLPHTRKRIRLAELALIAGAVSARRQ
jgi:pSer/pThr/pTyr-binding forkhead associated (FHA) protein